MKLRTVMHQTHAPMISCRLRVVHVYSYFSVRHVILLCVVKIKEKKEEKQTNGESVKNGGTFVHDPFLLHMNFVTFEFLGCLIFK